MPPFKPLKIVGLGGSLKPGSASVLALSEALRGAEEAGATVELLELHALALPMFVPDCEPTASVQRFLEATRGAAGMILARLRSITAA